MNRALRTAPQGLRRREARDGLKGRGGPTMETMQLNFWSGGNLLPAPVNATNAAPNAAKAAPNMARRAANEGSAAQKPAAITLRPYQAESIAAIEGEWAKGHRRTLLVLPTGCGKTIVFCKLTENRVRAGERVLILAHRGELLQQAADKLLKATGLRCAVEKAEESCLDSWYRVTVGSVQSLMREKRLNQFPPDYFGTIVIDEAHHVLSDGYQRVLEHFSSAQVLGVTATPDRGDMRNLGSVFESLAYEYTLPRAIREGYLSPIKAQTIPLDLDLRNVGVSGGDFKAGELGSALDPYLEQIAEEMAAVCMERKTVVFLPLIQTSRKFRDILNQRGFRAAEVNGESADRAEVLAAFDRGEYNVLCNSMLLTEGWDCPSVDCIVVLRPTKVRSLYCQMIGRGTRLHSGKEYLLVLDFLWHTAAPRAVPPGLPDRGQRRGGAEDDGKSGSRRGAGGSGSGGRESPKRRGGPAGGSAGPAAERDAGPQAEAGGPFAIRNEHSGGRPGRVRARLRLGMRPAQRKAGTGAGKAWHLPGRDRKRGQGRPAS